MNKRTPDQWQALFTAHQTSGLSQAQFCKREGLCPKYFSLRRRQLNETQYSAKPNTPLIQVHPPQAPSYTGVSLHYQGIEIQLAQADPQFIASVVKQLA